MWWVWLERCRDGSYVVYALRCGVWVVCACTVVNCTVTCFIGFWESVLLVGVHPYMTCFCTFWQSAFSVTCFGAFFWEVATNVNVVGMKRV